MPGTVAHNRPEFALTAWVLSFAKARDVPYDLRMKVTLAFLLLWVIPVFSQSVQPDPSRCLPVALGPFPFGGAARPETDAYLYPRYFRYVKQWDRCLAHGKWPASKIEQFPEAYASGLSDDQRKIVTREAYEWDVAPQEGTLTLVTPGTVIQAQPSQINTWGQMQQLSQQRRHDAERRDEQAKLVELRLKKLRLQLGEASFGLLSDHAHRMFHAIPGRLVRLQLPETAIFGRYLHNIAMMDKFAANEGDDGAAAARAWADEQKACGLDAREEKVLQRVADDLQKNTQNGLIDLRGTASPANGPTLTARPFDLTRFSGPKQEIDSHIAQLRSELGEASFGKVERRARALGESESFSRVVPVDSAKSQTEVGDQ
jgi:hypothetical protein